MSVCIITLQHSASECFVFRSRNMLSFCSDSALVLDFCSCRTFPSCKFGDKCLFVHPNCKYDARCTKPDCPFTHVSRRSSVAPPPRPGNVIQHKLRRPPYECTKISWIFASTAAQPAQATTMCRFFPECKNMDCQFYHPKVYKKCGVLIFSV